MPIPSPIKITKTGVEFISQVDRAKYTLVELQRAALRDSAKLLRRRMLDKTRARHGRSLRRGRRPPNAFQYWVRKRENNLQIGIKHDTWYGVLQELGTAGQPKRAILRDTTYAHVDEVRRVMGAYIKEIEDENRAKALMQEEVEFEDDEPG